MFPMTLTKASVQTLRTVIKWVAENIKHSENWSFEREYERKFVQSCATPNEG